MSQQRANILVLGVGNLLLGDEGIGVHLARYLQQHALPPEVEIVDGGTYGFGLAALCTGRRKVLLLDAVEGDAQPGEVVRMTLQDLASKSIRAGSAHAMNLQELMDFLRRLSPPPEVVIYGIVPAQCGHLSLELSPLLKSRLPRIASIILEDLRTTTRSTDACKREQIGID